jgi:hypothetical protein
LIWPRFGDVDNYVEPFAGSLAVLLSRPHLPKTETVNDRDAYIANFWRAVKSDPEGVAEFADWPVNEADLHARHEWLVSLDGFRHRMLTDPKYFNVKIAGYWVWGLSSWIGSGWCDVCTDRPTDRPTDHSSEATGTRISQRRQPRKLPELGGGRGIHRDRYQNSPASAEYARTHARTHCKTDSRPTRRRSRDPRSASGVSLTTYPRVFATSASVAVTGRACSDPPSHGGTA